MRWFRRIWTGFVRYLLQVGKALSRLLNAITGGEGDTTFSAYSYQLKVRGKSQFARRYGAWRVAVIDWFLGDEHSLSAWLWHEQHDLFEIEKD